MSSKFWGEIILNLEFYSQLNYQVNMETEWDIQGSVSLLYTLFEEVTYAKWKWKDVMEHTWKFTQHNSWKTTV